MCSLIVHIDTVSAVEIPAHEKMFNLKYVTPCQFAATPVQYNVLKMRCWIEIGEQVSVVAKTCYNACTYTSMTDRGTLPNCCWIAAKLQYSTCMVIGHPHSGDPKALEREAGTNKLRNGYPRRTGGGGEGLQGQRTAELTGSLYPNP